MFPHAQRFLDRKRLSLSRRFFNFIQISNFQTCTSTSYRISTIRPLATLVSRRQLFFSNNYFQRSFDNELRSVNSVFRFWNSTRNQMTFPFFSVGNFFFLGFLKVQKKKKTRFRAFFFCLPEKRPIHSKLVQRQHTRVSTAATSTGDRTEYLGGHTAAVQGAVWYVTRRRRRWTAIKMRMQ